MPINNAINAGATGLVRHNGAGVFDAVTTTNHDLLIGAASNGITNVAPSATSGVPVISQGASADPTFGTAVVAGGGTGVTSFTAYSVVAGGTTTTGSLQNVSGVGTTGQVLTSNGASTLPTWQTAPVGTGINKVIRQVFTASGTYTPSANMVYCDIEVCGGGGAGGGSSGTSPRTSGGGGGGGYAKKVVTAATIGASKAVTVGAGGVGVSNSTGGTGGTSSVGVIVSATGGAGGPTASFSTRVVGGAGGTGSSGDFNVTGVTGGSKTDNSAGTTIGSTGGDSFFGGGASAILDETSNGTGIGNAGTTYGGGGGGSIAPSGSGIVGGAGFQGIVIITEYTG